MFRGRFIAPLDTHVRPVPDRFAKNVSTAVTAPISQGSRTLVPIESGPLPSARTVDEELELYRAWRTGDAKSGARLVERHYDPVVRFFRTKVATAAADDLVQRTFLVCVESESGFRGEGSFRAYLFGVARRVLIGHFRDRHRGRIDADLGVSSIMELQPGPSTIAAGRSDQRLLVNALRRIPVDLQMALELFYWEGLSVGELAEALEVPAGTVKSRLHRARGLLREAMEKLPADDQTRRSVRELVDGWAAEVQARIPGET